MNKPGNFIIQPELLCVKDILPKEKPPKVMTFWKLKYIMYFNFSNNRCSLAEEKPLKS